MGDPIADYGAKILTRGFTISGDVRSGLRASVPYLLSWANATNFCRDMVGHTNASAIGGITFFTPYRLPGWALASYAQGFEIEPCGADGSALGATYGVTPGEFFTHARVMVNFETPPAIQALTDDPQGLNQLDPANPITLCEQSVKLGGKMITRKGSGYRYSSDMKPVAGDVGVLDVEAKLVLKFPRVPYLPWQSVAPYIGKINKSTTLGVSKGTLLLEGMDTDVVTTLDFESGTSIAQKVQLEFAVASEDWNRVPKPDGSTDTIYQAGQSDTDDYRIYQYVDFGAIFANLQFEA